MNLKTLCDNFLEEAGDFATSAVRIDDMGIFSWTLRRVRDKLKKLIESIEEGLKNQIEDVFENDRIRIKKSVIVKEDISLEDLSEFCSRKHLNLDDYTVTKVDNKKIKELKEKFPDLPSERKECVKLTINPR